MEIEKEVSLETEKEVSLETEEKNNGEKPYPETSV